MHKLARTVPRGRKLPGYASVEPQLDTLIRYIKD